MIEQLLLAKNSAMLRRIVGGWLLVGNSLLLNGVLVWLSNANHHSKSITILALGNLLLGVVGVSVSQLVHRVALQIEIVILWSSAYCVIYASYVEFPSLIPLSLVMIAQALAPTLAVLMTGDFRKDRLDGVDFVRSSYPLLLLLVLAAREFAGIGLRALLITLALSCCFVASQWSARKLAAIDAPFHVSSLLSLINGAILTLFIAASPHVGSFAWNSTMLAHSTILSIGIVSIQVLYLAGIRESGALASSFLLAANVPVAQFLQGMVYRRVDYMGLCIGLVYFLTAAWVTLRKERSLAFAN